MGGTEKAGGGDDSAQQQKPVDSGTATGLKVSIADFPLYDGSVSPEDFLAQCSRLAGLGGISSDSLASIVAARCSGRALSVVNELEQRLGRLSMAQLTTSLTTHFSAQPTAAQAAMQLAQLVKGRRKAREYGQQVRLLVRTACPEFFTKDGTVKNTSMPAYNAALFRHFLVGLSAEEATLISRLKATTFEEAIEELVREESLPRTEEAASDDNWPPSGSTGHVRWASPIRDESYRRSGAAGDRYSFAPRSASPTGRAQRSTPRSASPGDRAAPPRAPRSASPARRSASPDDRWGGGGWRPRGDRRGAGGGAGAAAGPGAEEGGDDDDRRPACWSCGGRGHFKRHCPNGWLAGRR